MILNNSINVKDIKDSKKINFKKRILLSKYIKRNSIYAVGYASVKEINNINILNASLLSMKRALKKIKYKPSIAYIDGIYKPKNIKIKCKTIIKGDNKIPSISAASIIAKVARDNYIIKLSKKFIGYSWETNFGYGTKKHNQALKKLGVTSHHRKTYKPVHNILSRN